MCGILGTWGRYDTALINKAAASISHRGPDAHGVYTDGEITLIHHRLSILDLSEKGNQPYQFMHLTLTYNGEIYNFQDIRQELVTEGYHFNSSSDTEVLIKAFHKWGVDAVQKFTGMFAFAIYDKSDHSIYVFRDRMGVKPLYYTTDNGFAFASELKAIMPLMTNKDIDGAAVTEYFRFGYISREKTIFSHAKKLLPGHYLHYRNGTADIKCYWDVNEQFRKPAPVLTTVEWQEELHKKLIDACTIRMVSDVPVGIFLSGGIDSSLVTAILRKHYGNIETFTIGFRNEQFNEAPYAEKIARQLDTKHTSYILEIEQAYEAMENFYDVYDEPFADSSGVPTTIISALAAKAGIKVVLSANGGDELFAGYPHYVSTLNYYNRFMQIPAALRKLMALGSKTLFNSSALKNLYFKNAEHRASVVDELLRQNTPGAFYNSFLANQSRLEVSRLLTTGTDDQRSDTLVHADMNGLMAYDMQHYLPDDLLVKMDRATMHNSIEGREPLLDHRLVELAAQMPLDLKLHNGESKWILKEILHQYLPGDLFMRPKMGFSIPIFHWFIHKMDDLFHEYIKPETIAQTGVLNTGEVMHEFKKYEWYKKHHKEYNIEKMWRILSFVMWHKKWMAQS